MRNKYYFIIALIVISISLITPSALWIRDFFTNWNESINSNTLADFATFQTFIISFWSLVANSLLTYIAYKAFKNFDVKKQFHNKQLDLVSSLATDISETNLSNMLYETVRDNEGKDHQILIGYSLSFYEISLGFDYSKYDLMIVKSNNIENTLPFLKYRNNPLLPKTIAKQLNKFYRPLQYSTTVLKSDLPKNYVLLYTSNIDKEDFSKDWRYKFYDRPIEFTKDSRNLRQSILDWLMLYGAEEVNL